VINDPVGDWYCDDDYPVLGLNAGWYFTDPNSGRYDIWVGTYSESNNNGRAILAISGFSDSSWETDLHLNTFPVLSLSDGFTPDPYSQDAVAGGSSGVTDLTGGSCATGYFTAQPNYTLNYTSGASELGIYIESDIDTALAIIAPDGNWYCNDDFN